MDEFKIFIEKKTRIKLEKLMHHIWRTYNVGKLLKSHKDLAA